MRECPEAEHRLRKPAGLPMHPEAMVLALRHPCCNVSIARTLQASLLHMVHGVCLSTVAHSLPDLGRRRQGGSCSSIFTLNSEHPVMKAPATDNL